MVYVLCPRGTWWCWGIDIGLAGEATHGIISEEEQLNSMYKEAEHEDSSLRLHVKGACRTGNPGHEYGFSLPYYRTIVFAGFERS